MDCEQAWRDMAEAVESDDWERAAEIADGLLEWLAKNGFPPRITGIATFDRIVAKSTCQDIAAWAVA